MSRAAANEGAQKNGVAGWPQLLLMPFAVVGIVTIYCGRLTGDEGWYAYAAANVTHGAKPYRDFLFTQTPLLPYVYGPWLEIFGHSLAAARWLSFMLAGSAAFFLLRLCGRVGGASAAWIAGLVFCLNLNLVFGLCSVITQPLTVFLTTLALFFAARPPRAGAIWLAVLCLTLAVLTRLSILPALPLLWVYLLARAPRWWRLVFATAAASAGLLWAAWRYFGSDGAMLFGIYQFHTEYYGPLAWKPAVTWAFARGFWANEAPIILCFVAALACVVRDFVRQKGSKMAWLERSAFSLYCLAAYSAVTLVHLTRLVPYPAYQTSSVAFAVVFAAVVLGRAMQTWAPSRRRIALLVVALLAVAGLPWQEYVIRWNGDGSLGRLREAAAAVKDAGAGPILTFDTEIALESGLPLLPDYELSIFSFFPRMEEERAERLHLVTARSLLRDLQEHRARVLCFTTADMEFLSRSGEGAAYQEILERDYRLRAAIPQYGQFFTTLYVIVPRGAPPAPP